MGGSCGFHCEAEVVVVHVAGDERHDLVAVDQRVVVLVRLQRRKRAHAEDAVNAAGIGRPQRLLKPHDRATGTGIHRAVKNYFS